MYFAGVVLNDWERFWSGGSRSRERVRKCVGQGIVEGLRLYARKVFKFDVLYLCFKNAIFKINVYDRNN